MSLLPSAHPASLSDGSSDRLDPHNKAFLMTERTEAEIAVVGAGPSGLVAALALNHVGAGTVLIGPPPDAPSTRRDTRTAALLTSSVDLLKRLSVWPDLARHAARLKAIRIVDDSDGVFSSPAIDFEARELGLEAFGYNIANDILAAVLYRHAGKQLQAVVPESVDRIEIDPKVALVHCAAGTSIEARLIAGADGRRSICRQAAKIGAKEWAYEQKAIAASFTHTRAHENVSTELHRKAGSVTSVPLPDLHASSLIWVGTSNEIDGLMRLDEASFVTELSKRLGGVLGKVDEVGPRASFPVAGLTADSMAKARTALIGEAAHVLPPSGAQGLNLGFRDAASLADCVAAALKSGADPGNDGTLEAYVDSRRLDVLSRTVGVDVLNRSLLTGFLPLKIARSLAVRGLAALPPLRRFVMQVGMVPPTELPSLMRPASG
jgi:2-octaprenyl-6-methoxyphenol hydroxylase